MDVNGKDICSRTYDFAIRICKIVDALPSSTTGGVIARQLLRAGTSVGANVEEAQGAGTRKDFARRMNIARSEAREAHYWLRLIENTGMIPGQRMGEIIQEADELVRILTTIVKKTKQSESRKATS